jgi:hypothetical protein
MSSRVRGEDGQAAIVLLMALVVILAVAGLVIDGAAVVTGKIGLQAEADAAARRGAEAVNAAAFEATGAGVLDPPAAEDAARSYVATTCPTCSVSVVATTAGVTVSLHRPQPTWFLRPLGVGPVTVAASSSASPLTQP